MIFSIEKRRFRKEGKLHETRSYYLRYRIGEMPVDKWKSLGVTDKQVADKKAHEFIHEREREAAGILEPKAVRDSAKKLLTAHLEDYTADLAARGRNGRGGRGARLVASRIKVLLEECEWQVPCNVTADSFITWRNKQTSSPRTLNHYLQGMISLLNWMEKVGRIKVNPLKNVTKTDERGKQKRVRRALSDEDLRKLVAGSAERGIIYFTAARTGLRQEELKQMTWGDLHLDATVPFVTVRDCVAKNKKEESVQLVPEIVEVLLAHRPATTGAMDLVFPSGIPRALRLQKDLKAIGIPYRDAQGRYADFHALRYTWATFLQRNGVAQRFAMKLMRHSDIKLTSKVYTDEMQLPIYDAIKNLPRLDAGGCYAQIRAQNIGVDSQNGSHPVATNGESKGQQTIENQGNSRGLSQPVATGLLERVKGMFYLQHEALFHLTGKVLNLTNPTVQKALLEQCQREKIEVLILDNLSCLFSGIKENDANDWELVLPWLLELRRNRIAVVFIAHAGRNGFMRGTSRREDAAFWVVQLTEAKNACEIQNGAKFVARFVKNRNTTEADCPPLEWHFHLPRGETRAVVTWKTLSTAQIFRQWIEEGLTGATDIAEEMEISKGQVSKLAKRGIADGWLKKEGRDYALASKG